MFYSLWLIQFQSIDLAHLNTLINKLMIFFIFFIFLVFFRFFLFFMLFLFSLLFFLFLLKCRWTKLVSLIEYYLKIKRRISMVTFFKSLSRLISSIGSLIGNRTPSNVSSFGGSRLIWLGGSCSFGAHPSLCNSRVSSSYLSLSFGGL